MCVVLCAFACELWVLHFYPYTIPQGGAIFVLHVVRHEKNWRKLKGLFTSKIGKKKQGTRSTQKSGTLSVCAYTLMYVSLCIQVEVLFI